MPSARVPWRFLAIFLVLYLFLVLPWPGWRDTYTAGFRGAGNLLFGDLFGARSAVFAPSGLAGSRGESQISFFTKRKLGTRVIPYNAHLYGYLPLVLLVSLSLATALPWRRRLQGLGLGLIALYVFLWLRIWLLLLREFCREGPVQLYQLPGWLQWPLELVAGIAALAPVPNFTLPVLIWVIVAFRLGGLRLPPALGGAADAEAAG